MRNTISRTPPAAIPPGASRTTSTRTRRRPMPAIGFEHVGGDGFATGHFEQAGSWSGTLTVDGRVSALDDGCGNRDKDWGPHQAGGGGGLRARRWFSVHVGDVHLGGGVIVS